MTAMNKNIIIGSDHAGFELKEEIKKYIINQGYTADDIGVYTKEPADYPVIAKKAAEKAVLNNSRAVLICGTGIGMCITANKVKGARAAVCSEASGARLSRMHNNSNILCIGARIIGLVTAQDIIKTWLETEFEGGRHQKRIDMIE